MQLTVIVPMYNASATIARTLSSLGEQATDDWEAIVVDDGSSDQGKGAGIVSQASVRDQRIRLIRQSNGGVCNARNRALDEARGDFILCLDSDDWMVPGGVDALLETARSAGAGGAIGKFEMTGGIGNTLSIEGPWSDEITLNHLLGGIFMAPHCHLVARKFYEVCNGFPAVRFDPETKLIEDTDVWLKLAERGVRWQNCHRAVGAYRMRSDSRSVDFAGMLHFTIRVAENAYARVAAGKQAGTISCDVDNSQSRLQSFLGIAAVGYCTRLAISRPDTAAAAFTLIQSSPGIKSFESHRLARAGRHAVMFALGDRPKLPNNAGPTEWWTRLQQWWKLLDQAGWIVAGNAGSVAAQFIEMSSNPQIASKPHVHSTQIAAA